MSVIDQTVKTRHGIGRIIRVENMPVGKIYVVNVGWREYRCGIEEILCRITWLTDFWTGKIVEVESKFVGDPELRTP